MGTKWWTRGNSWWYEPQRGDQTHSVCYVKFNNFPSSRQLEEIFRKKKDRKEVAEDGQRLDQQVRLPLKAAAIMYNSPACATLHLL